MNKYWATGVDLPNLSQPPLGALTDFLTPSEKVFFIRHMAMPQIDRRACRLTIGGLTKRPVELSLSDLARMAQTEVCAVHECAGHPFHPTVAVRRVANVLWGGVRLKDVLGLADISPQADYVWSQGADGGDYHGVPIPAYVKDLPLAEAQRAEVLLATHMNGDILSDKQGGPVRLVVPGYYGTNSTKWLVRLELQATRSPGYFTTSMYNDVVVKGGKEERVPVWRTAPHSVLVNPVEGTVLKRGRTLTIAGWAWGADPIVDVEVSTDAGVTWTKAPVSKRRDMSWQRFELDWTPQSPGPCRMLCRAVDSAGVLQPVSGTRNAVFSIDVSVE